MGVWEGDMTKPLTGRTARGCLSAFLKASIRLPASQEENKRKTEIRDVPLKW